jgi:hypothetical protein
VAAAVLVAGLVSAEEPRLDASEKRTVVAGQRYKKGGFYRFLFGANYRDVWTTPVELPVLDMSTYAGGLQPTRVVGHGQSQALALKGADGRSYTFRPVLKDATGLLPVELRESKARSFVQDQLSSGHPAGHVMVGPLLDAVGILHNDPRLVIMPDTPALGEFRATFAGAVGDIEEFTGTKGFKETLETIDGEEMWKRLRESPAVRPDARTYLKARLVDHVMGDWDRHRNQFRWARVDGKDRWQPMPEDRDQAFVRFEGAVIALIRPYLPLLVKFGRDYSSLEGLTFDGWDVDKRILAELEKGVWDETAREVKAALTDPVLERAARSMPPEYFAKDGARLLAGLKARRDGLPEHAARFYRFINGTVDVFATDQGETVTARRSPDGDLDLSVSAAGTTDPYFHRHFKKSETDEVRVYLYGGNDAVAVSGGRHGGVKLRVIGGAGQDVLDDTQGGGTRFSSPDADDRVQAGSGTNWDRRPYEAPKNPSADWIPPRDWGRRTQPGFRITYEPDLGVLLSAFVTTTGYGFRKDPYADRQTVRFTYAIEENAFRGAYDGDFRRENSSMRLGLGALASGLEVQRFFGLGNETTIEGDPDTYKIKLRQYALAPTLGWALGERSEFRIGVIGKYSDDSNTEDNPILGGADVYGEGGFGQVGAVAGLRVDTTEGLALPSRGIRLDFTGTVYPGVWDVESTFGKLFGDARVFLSPSGSWQPTLVLSAGGQKVLGDPPYFDSAFLGGRMRLGRYDAGTQGGVRGLRPQRYAGDGSVYGNTDLYLPVTRTSFLGIPLQFGVQGFADAGRVFVEDESSDKWHTGYGGGPYFASPGRKNLFSFLIAQSEGRTSFYLRAGFAF